jgi:2-dehydro-3-deoxyphosphooctonate aldolase (KDO 8-P synthase)
MGPGGGGLPCPSLKQEIVLAERIVQIGPVRVGGGLPLALIAGPCVIETRDLCLRIAERAAEAARRAGAPYIFKASYDKANRTSIDAYRGPGLEAGLRILEDVRKAFGVPVLSDVHRPEECAPAGQVLDILQIPAFLCRQTDLVVAAARAGRPLNIKKAQFMAPEDMGPVVAKAAAAGCRQVVLTDRGVSFGYRRLISDMRAIPRMQALGCPVVFDATHSVQEPGGKGDRSGGEREMAGTLALAAVAAGADGVFIETHPDPEKALSDAATMLPLDRLEALLVKARAIREVLLR